MSDGFRRKYEITEKHGTMQEYNLGCRCDQCKEANRIYKAEHRALRAGRGNG